MLEDVISIVFEIGSHSVFIMHGDDDNEINTEDNPG
jgi:hypothetical protein